MPTTNIIGPIDRDTWRSLVNARGALKVFKQDPSKYEEGIETYSYIYRATLDPYIKTVA